jgi:MSHA biogenesis protein MshN
MGVDAMSLINKMLQDLDSRGTPAGEGYATQVRPVMRTPARARNTAVALAVAGALVVLAGGAYVWTHLKPAAPAVAPTKTVAPAPKHADSMTSTIVMGPAQTGAVPVVVPAPVPAPSDTVAVDPPAVAASVLAAATPAAHVDRFDASSDKPAPVPVPKARRSKDADLLDAAEVAPGAPAARVVAAPLEPDSPEARAARQAILLTLAARSAAPLPFDARAHGAGAAATAAREDAMAKGKQAVTGRQAIGSQRAEGEYRRALVSLQEGRLNDTMDALEQALKYDPGHDAARQTLVGLLIEAKRPDDAIRQLQLGLTQDARQPALAMLLARLQIERGGNGIDTLLRTLPYAANDADYHAFLAAALARQQRHHEAADQYLLAVRGAPANGVWWMGLGISLEADKRNAEALEAFQKAAGSGVLSPELGAFVARRIQQLGH